MQIIEQKKMISDLKNYRNKMSKEELYNYDMYTKRTKDDEDLDKLSYQKLQELHKKYIVKKSREEIEKLFFGKKD